MALTELDLSKLSDAERTAFERAAIHVADGARPSLAVCAQLVLTIERLIGEPLVVEEGGA